MKQLFDTIKKQERKYTETYLLLIRNAAGKRAEARKRIMKYDENIQIVR